MVKKLTGKIEVKVDQKEILSRFGLIGQIFKDRFNFNGVKFYLEIDDDFGQLFLD